MQLEIEPRPGDIVALEHWGSSGMCSARKDEVNADLLAFVKG